MSTEGEPGREWSSAPSSSVRMSEIGSPSRSPSPEVMASHSLEVEGARSGFLSLGEIARNGLESQSILERPLSASIRDDPVNLDTCIRSPSVKGISSVHVGDSAANQGPQTAVATPNDLANPAKNQESTFPRALGGLFLLGNGIAAMGPAPKPSYVHSPYKSHPRTSAPPPSGQTSPRPLPRHSMPPPQSHLPPAKRIPDLVIQMLAVRAASNPELKVLMADVASLKATQAQFHAFQSHIDELEALLAKKNVKNASPLRPEGDGASQSPVISISPATAESAKLNGKLHPDLQLERSTMTGQSPAVRSASMENVTDLETITSTLSSGEQRVSGEITGLQSHEAEPSPKTATIISLESPPQSDSDADDPMPTTNIRGPLRSESRQVSRGKPLRRGAACDHCHNRKWKCSGQITGCLSCKEFSIECKYSRLMQSTSAISIDNSNGYNGSGSASSTPHHVQPDHTTLDDSDGELDDLDKELLGEDEEFVTGEGLSLTNISVQSNETILGEQSVTREAFPDIHMMEETRAFYRGGIPPFAYKNSTFKSGFRYFPGGPGDPGELGYRFVTLDMTNIRYLFGSLVTSPLDRIIWTPWNEEYSFWSLRLGDISVIVISKGGRFVPWLGPHKQFSDLRVAYGSKKNSELPLRNYTAQKPESLRSNRPDSHQEASTPRGLPDIHMIEETRAFYGNDIPPFALHTVRYKSGYHYHAGEPSDQGEQGYRFVKLYIENITHLFGTLVTRPANKIFWTPYDGTFSMWCLHLGEIRICVRGRGNHYEAWLGPHQGFSDLKVAAGTRAHGNETLFQKGGALVYSTFQQHNKAQTSSNTRRIETPDPSMLKSCLNCCGAHITCDKGQPECANCIRAGRKCNYKVGHKQLTQGRLLPRREPSSIRVQTNTSSPLYLSRSRSKRGYVVDDSSEDEIGHANTRRPTRPVAPSPKRRATLDSRPAPRPSVDKNRPRMRNTLNSLASLQRDEEFRLPSGLTDEPTRGASAHNNQETGLSQHKLSNTRLHISLSTNNYGSVPVYLKSCKTMESFFDMAFDAWDLHGKADQIGAITATLSWLPMTDQTMVVIRKIPDSFQFLLDAIDTAPCWEQQGDERTHCDVRVKVIME